MFADYKTDRVTSPVGKKCISFKLFEYSQVMDITDGILNWCINFAKFYEISTKNIN